MAYCWICETRIDAFGLYGIPPRRGRCPACGAKPRTRVLFTFLRDTVMPRLGMAPEVLEIGASRASLEIALRQTEASRGRLTVIDVRRLPYHALLKPPHRFLLMDASSMAFADRAFDLVLCSNVLPWIRDDIGALREIRRCLRSRGLAILNTHYVGERTMPVADFRALHPEIGDDYFAENGDQWIYGADLYERIRAAGLWPHAHQVFADFTAAVCTEYGLRPPHEMLLGLPREQDVAAGGGPDGGLW